MTRGSMDDTVYIGGIVGQVVDCKIYGCYQKSATLGSTFYWSAYGITTHANGYGIAGYIEYGADYTPVIDGCYSEANLVSEMRNIRRLPTVPIQVQLLLKEIMYIINPQTV